MTRTPLVAILAVLLALLAVAPVHAQEGGDDNSATAVNREDGASVFDLAFSVRRVAGDTVDETNTAVAYASCETCQTVAIAIQVVLVTAEDPDVVSPENVAVAVNEECTTCATFAGAYQFVYGRGGPVRITAAGRQEIARIRKELRELGRRFERGELTIDDVEEAVTELTADLRRVLDEELVPVGRGGEEDVDDGEGAPELEDGGRPAGEDGDVPAGDEGLPPNTREGEDEGQDPQSPGEGEQDGPGDPDGAEPPSEGGASSPPEGDEDGRSAEPDDGTTTEP